MGERSWVLAVLACACGSGHDEPLAMGQVECAECYSPECNVDRSYTGEIGGCACAGDEEICVEASGGIAVALWCDDGRWQAGSDGPCTPCVVALDVSECCMPEVAVPETHPRNDPCLLYPELAADPQILLARRAECLDPDACGAVDCTPLAERPLVRADRDAHGNCSLAR